MRRLFWVALGATAGVLVVRKLTQTARSLTPEGAADRVSGTLGGLTDAVRDFAADVKVGMAERDAELRHALGFGAAPEQRDERTPGHAPGRAYDQSF